MSENLDLVRALYAAWERGDFSSREWAHPQIEFINADGPAPGRWIGYAGMAQGWGDFLSAWGEYRIEAEDYRELDDQRVLALVHQGGRGKASGVQLDEMQTEAAALFHIREGKVTRLVYYWDRDRALADLGLKE
jgi:ketosteroid isomerase-like protein